MGLCNLGIILAVSPKRNEVFYENIISNAVETRLRKIVLKNFQPLHQIRLVSDTLLFKEFQMLNNPQG
jgi:(2Fe-2S) ferredoxin